MKIYTPKSVLPVTNISVAIRRIISTIAAAVLPKSISGNPPKIAPIMPPLPTVTVSFKFHTYSI